MSRTEEARPQHHHRSSLKQRNKPFKGSNGARSKSQGRTEARNRSASCGPVTLCKKDRKNRATLIQQAKRNELTLRRRMYSGKDGMPRMVMILPISSLVRLDNSLPSFVKNEIYYSEANKQNLHFMICEREGKDHSQWIMSILNLAMVADCVLLVVDVNDEDPDDWGLDALSLIREIGVSSSNLLLTGMAPKKSNHITRQQWLNRVQVELSSVGKVFCSEEISSIDEEGSSSNERLEFERILCQQHLNGISWRDLRPYMVADSVQIDESSLKVTGFIRGAKPFSANKLVHLPILGESFVISSIEAVQIHDNLKKRSGDMEVDQIERLYQHRDELASESLTSMSVGDPFSSESLNRVADEMMEEKEKFGNSINKVDMEHVTKLVPKGTSSYQAAWLEEEDIAEDEETESAKMIEEVDDSNNQYRMDFEEHNTQLEEHRKLNLTNRHFPDEIELDHGISAKSRLLKYRGVQSLRTSTWDTNENLPFEYSKIFQFANFKQSRKAAIDENDSPFHVGQKVDIFIEGLSPEQIKIISERKDQMKIACFGLLKYEQRQTVMNFTFKRSKTFDEPILNKQELVAFIGFRKFIIQPIWSEHSTNSLHKMIRVVDPENNQIIVGTIYSPVTFSPCPIILYKRVEMSNELVFVGSGSIMDLDPTRIILKRITLTGSPFKVHKRSAVIRFMFGRPEDINWFKPVELTTRSGARGHIKESLGTHGYMKCLFDRVIFHHDTVAMHLYKRVFPKWTTKPCLE